MGLCRRLVLLWIRRSNCTWSTGEGEDQKRNFDKGKSSDIELPTIAEAVAVEASSKNEVYAIPGHKNGEERGDGSDGESVSAPPAAESAVEENDVGHEGDQGPSFLGIPVPEPTPRVVGPDAAQNDADGKQKNTDLKASVQVKNPRVIRRGEFVRADRADYKKVG